jgi:hypothetical protein
VFEKNVGKAAARASEFWVGYKGFGLWAFFDLAKEPTQEHRMLPNTRGSSSHNHQHCQSLPVLLETVLDLYIKIF